MRVLVVGGGGREHALAWKLAQSPQVDKLVAAPGNAGIAKVAECVSIQAKDLNSLVDYAQREKIDLVVVGPEDPLCDGLVDRLKALGIRAFGPTRAAAQLEGSKVFSKEFMRRHHIPTAHFEVFDRYDEARGYVQDLEDSFPLVVKADGLALGKGVVVCQEPADAEEALHRIMVDKALGRAGDRVVIEECLVGQEVSLMVIADGKDFIALIPAQDHKAAYDGDQGPNTGGMGCYSPVPLFTPERVAEAIEKVVKPTIAGMAAEGNPFAGVLYAGLMVTHDDIWVLEYNCRFGDPETQLVLPLMQADLAELLGKAADGALAGVEVGWAGGAAVCVVMASGGYPGTYHKGIPIDGLEDAAATGAVVFHAGTAASDSQIVTAGGRVLGVTATGADHASAMEHAYAAVKMIDFDGAHYRRDIGRRAL